ncbi:MAG TPA: class E sortase [Verrucomicrobiae bacterium]|nr:class E sortase [Verrucomicrobiae bacterium]
MTLRRFNNMLSMVVIVLCLYVLLAPLFPQAAFWWRKSVVKKSPPLVTAAEGKGPEVIPAQDTLVIPRLQMQQVVHENKNPQWGLAKGVWHDPKSKTPGAGGNTVLTGHRFTYAGAAVFYHLDKLQVNDELIVYWGKKKYIYRVQTVRVVSPTEGAAIAATQDETLTIYTCTPLITARNRLVVTAKPVEEAQ